MRIKSLLVCLVIAGLVLFLAVPSMVFPSRVLASASPTVTGITPNQGNNGSTVHITDLAGTGFVDGATVKLYRAGSGGGANQVLNPGFENYVVVGEWSQVVFDNWACFPNYQIAQSDPLYVHGGLVSAQFGGDNPYIESADFININPAIPGNLTAWFYGWPGAPPSVLPDTLKLEAQCYDSGGAYLSSVEWTSGGIMDWQEFGGVIPSWPANTTKIKVRLTYTQGDVICWADDVSFTQASTPVPPIEIPATNVSVQSPEKITCDFNLTTPVSLGLYDVVVTNPGGLSDTKADAFTVNAPAGPPTVASITPNQGNNSSTVHITDLAGTGFVTGATVKLYRASSAGPNQVVNPGFEEGGLANWATSGNISTYSGHNSPTSARFNSVGDYIESADFININPTLPGNLTAWFSSFADGFPYTTTDEYKLEARCYDSSGVYLSSVEWMSGSIFGWQEIGVTIPSWPANTTKIKVRLAYAYSWAPGFNKPCCTDDVSFTQPIEIPATSVNVVSPTKITCNFNLTTPVSLGLYDVVVTNPDAQSGILANGFTITATYTLTPSAGANGTIDPAAPQFIDYGGSQTFNFTPDPSYHVADVKVDTVSVGHPDSYTFTNVTYDHTIDVTFTINQYTLTPSAGANGVIDPTTPQVVDFGSSQTFNFTANPGYHVADVLVDGISVGAVTSYTFGNVADNHTIAVSFAANPVPPLTPPPTPPTPPVDPLTTWYLAEGSTNWGFSTYIAIENPNNVAVTASVTYLTTDGPVSGGDISLPPMSQATVNPADKLGGSDFSTKVVCKEGLPIAVDRTMEWVGAGASSSEGHSSIGVNAPAKTWYLPEGCSAYGFETWLCVENPNNQEAICKVTYMTENAGARTFEKKVPANSRGTFNMADDIGAQDSSIKVESDVPILPERSVYRNNRRQGSCSIGATSPSRSFNLAEGTTAWGFTTYVLVQNPNDTQANVTVTYMTVGGPIGTAPFVMPPNSRKTIRVNDVLGALDFSVQVAADVPILSERSMYWSDSTGEACHDSIGVSAPHSVWYLPDGETSRGRETFTLVQNPNNSPATIEVSYLTPTGAGNVVFEDTVPPNSRRTYNMIDKGITGRAGVRVVSKGGKIIVERSMYWNNRRAGTDTIGGFSD